MRNDPQDLGDAKFVIDQAAWSESDVADIISSARVPDVPDVREQFAICAANFMQGGEQTNERVKLDSSAIASVTYDRTRKTLDVEFCDGDTYRYLNISVSVYRALLKAESAGAFWNEVKNDFDYVKLSD